MLQHKLSKLLRIVKNEDGIALVTSLMMTLITLAIIMSVLYLITSSIQNMGASKRYKSAMEAAYGGTELIVKDLFPMVMRDVASATLASDISTYNQDTGITVLANGYNNLTKSQQCLQDKLTKSTAHWTSYCDSSVNPTTYPDFQIQLPATNGTQFTVYSKIVDTVAGNTDTSGLQLEGAGVAESNTIIVPQHLPYVYRVEVQGQRSINPAEKSNISVLYAY
jgi:hypothetical protein